MRRRKIPHSKKSSQVELKNLLKQVNEQFPGVREILKVYGGYEEMERSMKQYLEVTQTQAFIITSNQTSP
ncbi:MAG: hypothetical protein ACUVWO_17760 [Thermodesulfobacteriota bacterium]